MTKNRRRFAGRFRRVLQMSLLPLTMLPLAFPLAWGQTTDPAEDATPPIAVPEGMEDPEPEPADGKDELAGLEARLDAQLERMQALEATLSTQQAALAEQQQLLADQQALIRDQRSELETQQLMLQTLNANLSQVEEATTTALQQGDVLFTERLDYLEQRLNDEPEDPLTALADETFPGSWRIPGTNAAMRIGGYVKMNIVNSFDPLLTRDRFIVGTIPPEGVPLEGAEKGAVLTVSQSRVNLDLRDKTDGGTLRAFVEGDFAGGSAAGESFRLRHAFGQYRQLLAGQTWSTLMDLSAGPEELDFEGINGKINVRQPQLRYFPKLGQNFNVRVALEDPAPDISGGDGSNTLWDLVASLDWNHQNTLEGTFFDGWTARTAIIGRQLKARQFGEDATKDAPGWGLTASGTIPLPSSERNKVFWQLTFGEGIGRYINDLGTIGGQDAIFSPEGELDPLPVFAGYLSYQHWWARRWRSNATFSWVRIDNFDYQDDPEYVEAFGPAYKQTLRMSANVLFNPAPRLEFGAELLWGERENSNNTSGDAAQLQLSARYLY